MKKYKLKKEISRLHNLNVIKSREIHQLKSKIGQLENSEKFILRDFRAYVKEIESLKCKVDSLNNRYKSIKDQNVDLKKQRFDLRNRLAYTIRLSRRYSNRVVTNLIRSAYK